LQSVPVSAAPQAVYAVYTGFTAGLHGREAGGPGYPRRKRFDPGAAFIRLMLAAYPFLRPMTLIRTRFCAAKKKHLASGSAYLFLRRTRFCVRAARTPEFGLRTRFCVPGPRAALLHPYPFLRG